MKRKRDICCQEFCDRGRWYDPNRGSVLPMVMGLGAIMMLAGAVLVIQSQQGQSLAQGRSTNGNSLAIAEGGVARTLALLTKSNNAFLLNQNYDEINPDTGRTYLGADGLLNSGDEEATAVSGWTNFSSLSSRCGASTAKGVPDISYTGDIGSNGQYKLLAYRYNPQEQTGTFLVEGKQGNSSPAHIAVKVSVNSSYLNFPGALFDTLNLAGRNILGKNGNVYYNPSTSLNIFLTGSAPPNSPNRWAYLFAIWSGLIDNVSGTIFACRVASSLPYNSPPGATNLGSVTATRTIANTTGGIEIYQTHTIALNNNSILSVDTTQGPVHIYVTDDIILRGTSQIRNVRSDGKPPRVGDLRLILGATAFRELALYDRVCIDTAFVYNANSDVSFDTTGDGCQSDGASNIHGVVWAQRMTITGIASSSGISVPDDISSLSDILSTINLPMQAKNQLNGVKSWQRVKL